MYVRYHGIGTSIAKYTHTGTTFRDPEKSYGKRFMRTKYAGVHTF